MSKFFGPGNPEFDAAQKALEESQSPNKPLHQELPNPRNVLGYAVADKIAEDVFVKRDETATPEIQQLKTTIGALQAQLKVKEHNLQAKATEFNFGKVALQEALKGAAPDSVTEFTEDDDESVNEDEDVVIQKEKKRAATRVSIESYRRAMTHLKAAKEEFARLPASRDKSCVITKIDEAILWARQVPLK